jgi:cell division protein ZapA
MKQVEVTILGQGYVLGCPEGGETLLSSAVADVDREMTNIRDSGKVKARERIAVLAALNLAYQLAEKRMASAAPAATSAQSLESSNYTVDIKALVQRIDTVLDRDGHLL